ncbi:inner nuclear membrane protein enriched at telomere/subtelomere region [Metarhizium acridum]|uniref:inner nuclear membrane protein enriched at telomere/subtelomere region n=1 Tax=Metarhizium acridum TaxID=92637 RepID=UPI001C6CA15F|nr:inner nuclear membrane protein enriched at telomere/subtelomere region [Metarhizium acridum]
MAEVDDYLQEGFDPRSVTVPRLRSILVTHNVDYPSTAKKGQLVDLVNDHVLSQAAKLRAQRAQAKRSSLGFVNAGSAEDSNIWDEHDTRSRHSSMRRSMSPRKSSSRIKTEPEEPEPNILRSPRKRSSRSASRQLSHFDEDDGTVSVASKMTRRSSRRTVTPQIKDESEEEEYPTHADRSNEYLQPAKVEGDGGHDESVFTDDNPFQSGSSPPPVKTPSNRRRTLGEDISKSVRSARRRTDGFTDGSKKSRVSEISAPRLRPRTPEFSLEPGEEFTAEEQLELEEAQSTGEVAPILRKSQKLAVGYCGLGRQVKPLLPPEIVVPDAILPFVEPQCEPCPANAYCYEGFNVRCIQGFIQKPHPLSFGGLVPLPPTCEPDSEQERRVQAVADKAVEELRERRAKYECGDLVDEAGQQEDSPAIAEEDLKDVVSKKRNKRLSDEEFDDLWEKAIGKVTTREEVEVQVETTQPPGASNLPVRKLSSTSLARLPLTCAIKRSIRLGLARYRLAIGFITLLILGSLNARSRYRRHVATSAQVPALVDLVLQRLADQRELGEEDLDDPWLFLPNLRDDVLRSIHALSERERIWQRVRAVVEQNSNVRISQREGRSGEVGRAWEWIGPTKGEGARRRRSGRVSLVSELKEETPDSKDRVEARKWDEPRPIY